MGSPQTVRHRGSVIGIRYTEMALSQFGHKCVLQRLPPFFEHLNADRQFRCCREELSSPGTECNQRREQSYRLFGQAVDRPLLVVRIIGTR